MNELKPCPFCGGEARVITEAIPSGVMNNVPYDSLVYCTECQVSQSGWAPKQQVVDEWNKRQNDWICVKDKLPKDLQRVFVYCSNSDYDFITICYYANNIFSEYLSECSRFNSRTLHKLITHWMPLPIKPEKNK